jgi:hypothetical protein
MEGTRLHATPAIPIDIGHLQLLSQINRANRRESDELLKAHLDDLRLLGTALSAIYQAATCHRKCWATGHVLEIIGGRIYNLACAAYSLICIGFYDEALNLTRSIGEAANLVSLSTHNKDKFKEWVHSSKEIRLAKFSPAKIRKLIGNEDHILMDGDWYAELCEAVTHITPSVSPNFHADLNRAMCGGAPNETALAKSLGQLTLVVGLVALFYCRYFEFDDLFQALTERGPHAGDADVKP